MTPFTAHTSEGEALVVRVARHPFHRVDIVQRSRHVRVEVDGERQERPITPWSRR